MGKNLKNRTNELEQTISALETRISELQKLTDTTDNRFQAVQTFRTDAAKLKGEIEILKQQAVLATAEVQKQQVQAVKYGDSIEELVGGAQESQETFDEHSKNLQEIEEKIGKFETEIVEQLGRAGSGALALAFASRQSEIETEFKYWKSMLQKTTGALIIVGTILFIYSVFVKIDFQFLLKITVSFPFIYAVWFSGKQYNKERFILESYAFKAAQAKSLSAFSKTVKEMDSTSEGQTATQTFVINSVEKIYLVPEIDGKGEEFPLIKIAEKCADIVKEAIKTKP